MSTSRRPGTTTEPSLSTCASSDVRSDSSMSVAARRSSPAAASNSTPARICTELRVDTARETTPSLPTNSSRLHVTFMPAPIITSASIIYLKTS